MNGSERKKIQNRSATLNFFSREAIRELSYRGRIPHCQEVTDEKTIQNRSAILNFCSREITLELSCRGGCENTSIYVGVSKAFILSISGPWDLLETIPLAISDRMVQVPLNLVNSRAILGRNKFPRALSMLLMANGGGDFSPL